MFRKFIAVWVVLASSVVCRAQQEDHFIYFQSDNKLPFYVRLGGTGPNQTSSSSGYLILPRVPTGSFGLVIGFPDQSYPEQHFTIAVPGDKDKGYLVKRFNDKGWALYDLQNMSLTFADTAAAVAAAPTPTHQPAPQTTKTEDTSSTAKIPVVTPPKVDSGITGSSPAPAPTETTSAATALSRTTQTSTTSTQPAPDSSVKPASENVRPANGDSDSFGSMLVAVTRDPTLTNIHVAPKEVPVSASIAPATPLVQESTVTHAPTLKPRRESAAKSKYYTKVRLIASDTTTDGIRMTYVDRFANGKTDTIRLFLRGTPVAEVSTGSSAGPAGDTTALGQNSSADTVVHVLSSTAARAPIVDSSAIASLPPIPDSGTVATPPGQVNPASQTAAALPTDTVAKPTFDPSALVKAGRKDTAAYVVPVFKQSPGRADTTGETGKAVDSTAGTAAPGAVTVPAGASVTAPAGTPPTNAISIANTDCKRVADDDDFMHLRKRMASEPDPDKMMEAARKAFRKSCFTTDQVRNLSYLFLQPEGKFRFLEEAYPYVSDTGNFKSLEALFTDQYYINRFRALVQR